MSYTTRHGKLVRIHSGAHGRHRMLPPVEPANKGEFGGSCNRSACLRPGANWYNHSTRKYYCESCAHWLNTDEFNKRDSMELWGHDLCTEGKEPRQ